MNNHNTALKVKFLIDEPLILALECMLLNSFCLLIFHRKIQHRSPPYSLSLSVTLVTATEIGDLQTLQDSV